MACNKKSTTRLCNRSEMTSSNSALGKSLGKQLEESSKEGKGPVEIRYSRHFDLPFAPRSQNVKGRKQRSLQSVSSKQHDPQNTVVPKLTRTLAPKGYSVQPIIPAAKAELLPVAQAMHGEDFAPRVKKLFDPEREAALDSFKTGVYIGWRCKEFKHDCIRVGKDSKCFCGHCLCDHAQYTGESVMVPCSMMRCECKAFVFVPSRPEEAGEFWLQRRPGYDPTTWRAKCKCKHSHEEHHPSGFRRCKHKGCGCSRFFSNFLCAACDRHWEEHETFFETAAVRKKAGMPYGEAYLPFHEFPELRNAVLTGSCDDNRKYEALSSGAFAIPDDSPTELALRLRGVFHQTRD
ncbi:PREDICTED: protein FAM221B-like [Acropora digitifera]|uniref:protein FAM221B-like n=1 Tax=Acropora digitifera TaxID=70779 RepID=UPI00077A0399|nr:PREDICTED: protein FAM221B-like [Acropora digitifera]